MIFRFVVKRLRWLARIPGLPQIFDAMLLAWTAAFNPVRLAAMEGMEASSLEIPGVRLRVHRFGGIGFVIGGHELGHLHGNGLLDVKLSRQQRDALVSSGDAKPHHIFGNSSWVSFWIRSANDVPKAITLVNLAATNNSRLRV